MSTVAQHQSHHPLSTIFLVHVSNWLEIHPKAFRHFMRAMLLGLIIFTLFNAGLFTVQNGRTSAFTKISGVSYSNMSIADASESLKNNFKQTQLTAKIGNQTVSLYAEQSGVKINADKTFKVITEKKGWQKLPIISTIHNLFTSIKPVYDINEETLAANLSAYVKDDMLAPKEPTISIPADKNSEVTIADGTAGHEMSASIAAEQLVESINKDNFAVKISPVVTKPEWTAADIEKFMPAIDAARATSLTIQAEDKKITIDSLTLAPMLRLDTSGKSLKITLDAGLLKAYLDSQATTFYEAPVATKTVQRDGTEVSRQEGKDGKQIDTAATAALAISSFENGVMSVTPKLASLTPEVLVSKTYSNTSEGLYKTIEDFAKTHAGTYRVAAVELSGANNRSAFYNADSAVVTASTFKLFVAYGILQDIENGKITMNTSTSEGSVSDCMYKMIHISDNDCASALQSLLGFESFQARLKADGMPNTDLIRTPTKDKHSTARDEMTLVTKLYNHELINEDSLKYLLDLMENQVYRSGIPAGSHGALVADKVGFLYALNHDIGIVYGPKSTYALVILTDGAGGWNNVRLLADQVYGFYNQ